jgi:hypothetical protein
MNKSNQINGLTDAPKVSLVGLSNNPAIEGAAQQFILTSKGYNGKVQYQIFLIDFDNPNRKNPLAWKKIQDWTAAVDAKTPFVYSVPAYSAGHYSFAIRVKRAGYTKYQTVGYNATGEYDNAYAFEYTFKAPGTLDVSNIKLDKNVYSVNEKITVTGLNGVNTYRLHTFIEGEAAPVWSKSPVAAGTKLEWTPAAPGSYVPDTSRT